eukprot:5723991-Alexandrium_andersonii.AAC.1
MCIRDRFKAARTRPRQLQALLGFARNRPKALEGARNSLEALCHSCECLTPVRPADAPTRRGRSEQSWKERRSLTP